jgi:hypothetical protein
MSMTKASMDAQTKRAVDPDSGPMGAGIVDQPGNVPDAEDTQSAPTQSPASLPLADPAKQNNASTNDGGKTQAPITGWVNSKKVVTTFDGTEGPMVDFGDAQTYSGSTVAIKP